MNASLCNSISYSLILHDYPYLTSIHFGPSTFGSITLHSLYSTIPFPLLLDMPVLTSVVYDSRSVSSGVSALYESDRL